MEMEQQARNTRKVGLTSLKEMPLGLVLAQHLCLCGVWGTCHNQRYLRADNSPGELGAGSALLAVVVVGGHPIIYGSDLGQAGISRGAAFSLPCCLGYLSSG